MQHLTPQPKRRRPVSERVQRLISYAWIIASLALPALGIIFLSTADLAPVDTRSAAHTVRAGESLAIIARRYGVTVDEIVQANGLNNPNLIYAGQVLTIPLRDAAGSELYTVQRGDSLSAIARRYGVTVDALMSANGLNNPNSIFAGQQLNIPGRLQSSAGTHSGSGVYTVQRGDSLSAIARRYGVTVEALMSANGLNNPNSIFAGQALNIPGAGAPEVEVAAPPDRGLTYTLQRGDSLFRVSLIYGVTVDELLAVNNLASPNAIYTGLEVRIPEPEQAVASAPEAAPGAGEAASPPSAARTHTVQWGDTLAQIAMQHNVTVDGLVAANGLTRPDRIYVGQTINIPDAGASARPQPAQAATAHRVQRGETLSSIALRYGVTVHSLAAANGIQNTSRIYAGMALSIPSAQAGSNSVRYASYGPGLCPDARPARSGTGYFIRPTRGYVITQIFHPWHPGIDLALSIGSDVYAADGGTVVFAGWNPVGYGNLVVLDHGNGWRTYYAHLSTLEVGCSDWVPRGTILGQIGSTGNSTGPHLHFEMLRFGVAVNPAGYIRF